MKEFLAQFARAKAEIRKWPKWMQEATRTATASFPKKGKKK